MQEQAAQIPLPVAPLLDWLRQQQAQQAPAWRQGNQAQLLRYCAGGWDVVIKCPHGSGLRGWWSRWTLRREYRAYQRLSGLVGVPRCHGLLPGGYLVLEHIPAQAFRDAAIAQREAWFAALLKLIQAMHACGVAHGDLKRKANLLVSAGGGPVIVDFGTAWLRPVRWRPLHMALFRFLCRTDLNAYVKHKYHGRYQDVAAPDKAYLRYSRLEAWINSWRHWREERRLRRQREQD